MPQQLGERLAYMQSDPQQKTYRWGETLNTTPTSILAILLWCAGFYLPTTWSPLKSLSFSRLHAYIWLLKTYAIPAGMEASQICATPYLQQGKDMDSPQQKWLLAVLKRILGVRDTTSSWCVMRECGLEPLQFNWLCAAMRLYNSWINPTATREKGLTCWRAAEYTIQWWF